MERRTEKEMKINIDVFNPEKEIVSHLLVKVADRCHRLLDEVNEQFVSKQFSNHDDNETCRSLDEYFLLDNQKRDRVMLNEMKIEWICNDHSKDLEIELNLTLPID